MATEEANLDFDWRNPTNRLIANQPWPLENYTRVKCYRNVIFIWLFHTPLLLNWIVDNHEQHGEFCPLCNLRGLAERFWFRDRDDDEKFHEDVDKFWKNTYIPGLIENLDRQNDAEEYMRSLIGYIHQCGVGQWAELIQVQKQCVKICRECSFRTQDSKEDFEEDILLQGTISRKDIEYQPLCQTLQFSKSEKATCKNESCPSKKERKSKSDEDLRPEHEFFYGLRGAPPILVIHCKPYTYTSKLSNGMVEGYLSGKITRLEHSLALSSYPDRSLQPDTINWVFYHLYGVVFRRGNTGSTGHYVCAFEQRQTGRWLFFDDVDGSGNEFGELTEPLTRSQLDMKVDEMQKNDWRVFMVMYRRLFQVPIRQLTTVTFPSTAIAPQNQQSHEESEEPETEHVQGEGDGDEDLPGFELGSGQTRGETIAPQNQQSQEQSGEPETEDAQEEFFTPEGGCVGDEKLLDFEFDSGQTRSETHGAADDGQGDPSSSETRNVQAGQPMATEPPAVEADPESSASKPTTEQGEMQGAADNVSQRDASESKSQVGQAEQPSPTNLPTNLPTEQGVAVELDPESSASQPGTGKTGSRAQVDKSAQKDRGTAGNEDMEIYQVVSDIVSTEVEPSAQPKEKQAKSKATKRTRDKALNEDEETSIPGPASKKAKAGVKLSTEAKKKETKPKATKRARKETSDEHDDEKTETSEPSTKKAKIVFGPSTARGGRETRSRARAKRANDEIPDVDKNKDEQAATSKPAPKKAKTTKASVQTGKTGRKK